MTPRRRYDLRNVPFIPAMSDSESSDASDDGNFGPPPWAMRGSPRRSVNKANGLRIKKSAGMFDHLHLAGRPRSWRPEFKASKSGNPRNVSAASRSLAASVANRLSCFRRWQNTQPGMHVSLIRGSRLIQPFLYLDRPDVTLSTHVAYTTPIAFTYDMRYPHNHLTKGHTLRFGLRNTNADYCEMATTPAVQQLRMYHPSLPWYIDVKARNSYGITVGDVYHQLYESLRSVVPGEEFYTNELDADDREAIIKALEARCGKSQRKRKLGMMRVDFMKLDVLFLGLEKSDDDMWLMKTESIVPG